MNPYIYNIKDIMRILRISRNTAYKLMKQELFPFIKIGSRYKIPVEQFQKWFQHCEMKSSALSCVTCLTRKEQ